MLGLKGVVVNGLWDIVATASVSSPRAQLCCFVAALASAIFAMPSCGAFSDSAFLTCLLG